MSKKIYLGAETLQEDYKEAFKLVQEKEYQVATDSLLRLWSLEQVINEKELDRNKKREITAWQKSLDRDLNFLENLQKH